MKYQIVPTANMMSISGDTSGSRIWKITMFGSATQPSAPLRAEHSAMFVNRLQNAERPAETLAHQAICVGRRLGIGERHVFVLDAISAAQQRHGEVGILGDGIDVIAASLAHCGNAPRADRAGHDADRAQNVERAPLKILAGDVFQGLPARPEIDAVADLGIAGNRADFRIDEVRHQSRDRVRRDDRVGIDADEEFRIADVLDAVVQSLGLARVRLAENQNLARGGLRGECARRATSSVRSLEPSSITITCRFG